MKTVIDQIKEMEPVLYLHDKNDLPSLIDRIEFRQEVGLRKYGHSIDRDDLSKTEWLQHLQEELLDAIQYALKAGEKDMAANLAQDAIDVQRRINDLI